MIDVGERAPTFALPDAAGVSVRSDSRAAPLLLVFLPAAFTAMCGAEVRALDSLACDLADDGVRTWGVACDSMFALRSWAEAERLSVPLLSDFWPHGRVSRSFGAFDDERGIATRSTYVIDRAGVVRWRATGPAGLARDLAEPAALARSWGTAAVAR